MLAPASTSTIVLSLVATTHPLVSVTQARHQGAEPTIKHNAPSWSCNKSLGQSKIRQRRTCKNLLKNSNIKEKNQIYYSSQSEHSLIIHQIPANSENYKGASIM